jgi:transposase
MSDTIKLRGGWASLSQRETDVLNHWDEGKSIEDISKLLSVSRSSVQTIIHRYSDRSVDRWAEPARQASGQLAAAILRLRGSADAL